jgi:hypothetical protein
MTVVASHSFAEMMPQQQQQQQQSGNADPAEPKLHWLLVPGGVGAPQAAALRGVKHCLCCADAALRICSQLHIAAAEQDLA